MKQEVTKLFESNANETQAVRMSAYMKNNFPFLGITKPNLRKLIAPITKKLASKKELDKDFILWCYSRPEREYHYLAIEYLSVVSNRLTINDIPLLEMLITTNSWWDSTDAIDGIIDVIAARDPDVDSILLRYSVSDNIWLRRISIIFQLKRKDRTDTKMLEAVIRNNLDHKEFFVNKAIGWALREYSKTNPNWVNEILKKYQDRLSPLSYREAIRHMKKTL